MVEETEGYVKAVADAMAEVASAGFPGQFEIDGDDVVLCLACRSRCAGQDVAWLSRVHVTCPTAERSALVCGLRCPICGMRGTATATVEQWERRRGHRAR